MIKNLVVMTTLPSENEQTGVAPKISTPGTYTSRPFGDFARFSKAVFLLDVSSVTGTGTLDVTIEAQDPVSLRWHTVLTFPQQTGVSTNPLDPMSLDLEYLVYRAKWVEAGASSSFTFTLCAIVRTEEPWV